MEDPGNQPNLQPDPIAGTLAGADNEPEDEDDYTHFLEPRRLLKVGSDGNAYYAVRVLNIHHRLLDFFCVCLFIVECVLVGFAILLILSYVVPCVISQNKDKCGEFFSLIFGLVSFGVLLILLGMLALHLFKFC